MSLTPKARKARGYEGASDGGVDCTCSKCCSHSCSACHHNYVKPVSDCMGTIRTMMVPSNNRVQIVPITEQSNGINPITMTRNGGRTRRRKRKRRRKSTKKKRRRKSTKKKRKRRRRRSRR